MTHAQGVDDTTDPAAAAAAALPASPAAAALAAIPSGVPGGWSIETQSTVNGARLVQAVNADKDGSIVAARVASALQGLGVTAVSDTRRSYYDPTRMVNSTYARDIAKFIVTDL